MATAIVGQGNAAPIPQQHEGVRALNAEQLRLVLQTIARRAEVARQLIWRGVDGERAELLAAAEAAATIVTSIGAIADDSSGAEVMGDADYWNHGPDFRLFGEEVRHD